MSIFRTGCFFAGSIALGFAAGWYLHQPKSVTPIRGITSNSLTAVEYGASASQSTLNQSKTESKVAGAGRATPTVSQRLATLVWLKEHGIPSSVQIFSSKGISDEFALFYGLTSEETARLNQAFQQTNQRLGDLSAQHARTDPASSAKTLIVTVAAFPEEGGKLYSNLLSQFAAVLGPDRYTEFNEISGDALESSFDGFGTARNQYEIGLAPSTDGKARYNIKRSFFFDSIDYGTDPKFQGGTSGGTSFNNGLDTNNIIQSFPVLKAFTLPTGAKGVSK